jgi:hypothetical protein
VRSYRAIRNNKPDIVIRDNENGTRTLIGDGFAGENNVIENKTEMTVKYKDRTIEIQRMCTVKTKVLTVIIGATGIISKSFRKQQ